MADKVKIIKVEGARELLCVACNKRHKEWNTPEVPGSHLRRVSGTLIKAMPGPTIILDLKTNKEIVNY